MGKHKLRLSDMLPNAWFYKLRDMTSRGRNTGNGVVTTTTTTTISKPRKSYQNQHNHHHPRTPTHTPKTPKQPPLLPHRASYYYTPRAAADTEFKAISPPRKSKRRHRRRVLVRPLSSTSSSASSPVSSGCRCGRKAAVEAPETPPCRRDMFIKYEQEEEEKELYNPMIAATTTTATDIIIDIPSKKISRKQKTDSVKVDLPPIITKPKTTTQEIAGACEILEDKHIDKSATTARRRRLRTRVHSPRVVVKKKGTKEREKGGGVFENSFAVVMISDDPRKDIRESMEEMIAENQIHAAKDLEELLACYLTLNSVEYHDLIVDVFKQIWINLTHVISL